MADVEMKYAEGNRRVRQAVAFARTVRRRQGDQASRRQNTRVVFKKKAGTVKNFNSRSSSKKRTASKSKKASGKRSRSASRSKRKSGLKKTVRSVINSTLSTHVFSRQTQLVATSAMNQKAFMILKPCNDPSILELYLTTLVGTDGFVEKSGRALVVNLETILELTCGGNPMSYRINWLTPRQSKATMRQGGIPKSASTIATLLTSDDTLYGQTLSLATSLQNTIYDSPSVCREYVISTGKWKRLELNAGYPHRIKMTSKFPKILDSGVDKIGDVWLYLKGTRIPVIEFKGFTGFDVPNIVTNISVPAANAPLTQYDLTVGANTTATTGVGNIFRQDTTATHLGVSSSSLFVRRYDKVDLKIISDETREISNVNDVTPSSTKPFINMPLMSGYQAAT